MSRRYISGETRTESISIIANEFYKVYSKNKTDVFKSFLLGDKIARNINYNIKLTFPRSFNFSSGGEIKLKITQVIN